MAVARLVVVERGGSTGYKVAGGRRSSSRSSRSRSRWGSRSRSRESAFWRAGAGGPMPVPPQAA